MDTDTRTIILETARRLFIQQGYAATSIRQLANEAGIGKATIYHHFKNKEALITTLLAEDVGPIQAVFDAVQAGQDPRRRIAVAIEAGMRFFAETAGFIQVARRELPGGRELTEAGFMAFYQECANLISQAISDGIESGIFRFVDAQASAQILMNLVHGAVASNQASGGAIKLDERQSAMILEIFFEGIQRSKPQT